MGVSVTPKLVIGVKSSTLVKSEVTDETFDVHDERGNKTGETATESTKTIYLINEPVKKVKDEGYLEEITELLGLEDYPNDGVFGFHNTDYETDDYLETGIVGICVATLSDVMYGSQIKEVEELTLGETIALVRTVIKAKYGVDVEPSIFLYANVG